MADHLLVDAVFFPKHPTIIKISNKVILDQILQHLECKVQDIKVLEFVNDSFYAVIMIEPMQQVINGSKHEHIFYGDIVQSYHAAKESAYEAAIEGLKKKNNLIIQDHNYAELQRTTRKLQQSLSWENIFRHSYVRLKQHIKKTKANLEEASLHHQHCSDEIQCEQP